MKYNIYINQYAAVKHKLTLDIIDLAIFDFMSSFCNSAKCIKMQTIEGDYFWISHKLIIKEIPLLGIKSTRGISKRIDKLIENRLLKKHPDCETLGRTLYKFGKNYDLLTFSSDELSATPLNESSTPPRTKVPPPLNESSTYNSNNTIIELKDYSFISEELKEAFSLWITYKKEKGQKYKSETSIKIAYNQLVKYSENNPDKAIEIVERSIANNWAGMFPYNKEKTQPSLFPKKQGSLPVSDYEDSL